MKVTTVELICTVTCVVLCGLTLASREDRVETHTIEIEKVRVLTEWEMLEMAIAKTESDFNPLAVGWTDDVGILQITPIYVKEANRLLGEERYTHDDAFDVSKSLEMFTIVQTAHNEGKDITKAIYLHNPGGDSIGYCEKVMKNLEFIKRYEGVRNQITK